MSNFINFIKYQNEENKKKSIESNSSILYLLDDSFQINVFKYMPKDFTITTNNGSCKFNIYMLNDTSSVIANLNQNNPQDLKYCLNINDEENVLGKFEQMYQGKIVHFKRSDLDVAYKIVDILNINCISLDDSKFQINIESFINFLEQSPLETFIIHANKKNYKCNIFGVLSSTIIREYLSQNTTKKEFKFDYDDEFAEFQSICDILNFKKVTITADNMQSFKEISDHLCIENISEKIHCFYQKYENLYDKINKHQKTIDSIDSLFNLLCQIKEKNVKFVSDSIIQSFWVKTEEDVQELAEFIIQVANTDMSLQPHLIDLLIQLDKESNETNKLKILIPFIVKKLNFKNSLKKINKSIFNCSFVYNLSKRGIISKEELLNELIMFFKKLKTDDLYSNPYQKYDDDDRKLDFVEKKFESNFVHYIYIWFLPEIVEINQFEASHIKSEKVNKFINSFYPDNLDQYKKIRDNMEPNDALAKALRNDDVDTLQLILLNGVNPKTNPVVPFNMFEFFVPNGETNYLNYSAAYGSIKCFKHLLSNHFECDLSTFSFAVLGGNNEIIKMVDEKSNELSSLPSKYNDDQNFQNCYSYAVYESRNRESNFYKIAPSIVKHQNDIFDWILKEKFTINELNDELIYKLLGISAMTGNIHSFIEIIKKHLLLPNDLVVSLFSTLCLFGFYQFAKIFYILLNKDNGYHYYFNDLQSVFIGNLSIFKLCLNGEKTEKILLSAFKLAVKYFNLNIIEYFFDKLVNEGLHFNLEVINESLEIAIKEPSGEIFFYLFNKFEKLLNSQLPFNSNILKKVCKNNNLQAAKLVFENYFSSNKNFDEKDVTDYFIIAANNGSFEICKYLIESQFLINLSELSKSYNKFTSIDEKTFSLMIDNCDPFIKQQFLYYYFEPSVKNKQYDFVEFLLKQNVITDSALFIAIENEDLKMIELILLYKNNPSFSINKKYQESTALCKAVKGKNIEIIKTLLSVPSIDPNLCDDEYQTPLMIAFPNIEIMNIIIDFIGDDIIHQTMQLLFLKMQTFIMFDLDKEKATRLLETIVKIKGIELNSPDNNFLIYACRDNNIKVFNMLINLDNIDLNICDSFNCTPLTTAIVKDNINIAELLIKDQRTDINKNTSKNESPLLLAVSRNQEKIVDLLLNHDKFDPIESHLDLVFKSSRIEDQLKILNSKHFDVNHMLIFDDTNKSHSFPYDDDFENALQYAVNKNDQILIDSIVIHPNFDKNKSCVESIIFKTINKLDTFKKLLNLLTNEVNDYKCQNLTLFDYSFNKMNIRSLKEIINHPCFDSKKINIQDCFYSCFQKLNEQSIEMMKFLYEFDTSHEKLIDLNQLTKSGETVFTLINNNTDYGEISKVVNFLLVNGADPNNPNKEGKYPLQHAIQLQSFDFVNELLKTEKIDVTKRIKSLNNATYLHLAALVREPSIFLEILKLNKIDINATDDNGETPLIYVARFGRPKNLNPLFMFEKLDYLHCNNQNKNALQIAVGNNADRLNQLDESQLKDKFIFYQKLMDEIGNNNNFDGLRNVQNYIPYIYSDENEAKIKQLSTSNNDDKNISDFVDNSGIFTSDDDSKSHSDVIKSSDKSAKKEIKTESLPKLQKNQNSDDHHLDESQTNKSVENYQANREKLPKLNHNKSSIDHYSSDNQETSKISPQIKENPTFSNQNNAEESKQNLNEKLDQSPNSNEVFQIKEPNTNSNKDEISNKNSEINSSPRSFHNQLKTLQNKAGNGDAESQYALGIRYSKGRGVPVDKEKAFSLYLSAAELGNMNAQYSAASCYSYGKGTEINKKKAFELYLKSAEQGFDKAQFAVAHFYQYGLGEVKKNHEKAIEWYQKAANQGHKGSIEALDLH